MPKIVLEPAVAVPIISAVIAAVSAAIAFRSFQREQLNQKIQAAKWKKEYFADLLKWSDESMLILSESLHLCDLDPQKCEKGEFFETRHALRIKLSAQIDKGRWFFPNYASDEHGLHKEEAFRGYRQAVLNGLVIAYRAVTDLDSADVSKNGGHRTKIESGKRLFTSEIQKILNPRSRDEEFRKLTERVERG